MVIVDTTVWIDYLGGIDTLETTWLDRELTLQRLGLTDLILCEVLQGIDSERDAARTLKELRRFAIYSTNGTDLAVAAAGNYRLLWSKGRTIRKTSIA